MVPEADLEQTDAGLVPAGTGWFVLNARDGRWFNKPGRGDSIPLTGCDEYEAVLIVEGQERPLKQWDFVGSASRRLASGGRATSSRR